MSTRTAVAVCLAAAAVTLLAGEPGGRRLLRQRLRPRRAGPARVERRLPPVLVRLCAGLGGVAAMVVIGGWIGAVIGVGVAAALDRVLPRLEPAGVRAARQRATSDLPLAADLLAAVLRGGAPVDRAVGTVGAAVAGPLGERLERVGRELRLGATSAEAWRHVADVAGAERLVGAAVRSARSGASLAAALSRVADDLRTDRATSAEARARRAAVLIVLPLGLCFLPAFVLAGLVPVIVAVLGDVLQNP